MILSILTGLLCAALIVIGLIGLISVVISSSAFIQGIRRGLEARRREQDDDAS